MCKCSIEGCKLKVFENSDKCVLHCEKDDWDNEVSNNHLIETFWTAVRIYIKDMDDGNVSARRKHFNSYEFKNVIFPKWDMENGTGVLNGGGEEQKSFFLNQKVWYFQRI